jgi:hypothetical protein
MVGEKKSLWFWLAKNIEDDMGCHIIIRPVEKNLGIVSRVVTDEEREIGTRIRYWFSAKPKVNVPKVRRHFIFYMPCPEDVEVERFRIAHELGHCALHWPLDPSRRELEHNKDIPDTGRRAYAVRFSQREEAEADVFACLALIKYQSVCFGRREEIELKDITIKKVEEYMKKNLLHRF